MALVILGSTPCSICRKPLLKGDAIVSFSPFVANRRDPLYRFSDASFHRSCFDADLDAARATRRREEIGRRGSAGERRCVVCGDAIKTPDDYFGTGFLTDDGRNPVFEFNYIHLHRSHFSRWDRATEFRNSLERYLASTAWDGPQVTFDPLPAWTTADPRRSNER